MIMLSLFLTLLLQFAQALPRGRGGGGRGSSAGGGAAGKFWRKSFLKIYIVNIISIHNVF